MVAAGCPAGQKTRALPDRRGGPVTYSALHVPLGRASRPSRAELAAVCPLRVRCVRPRGTELWSGGRLPHPGRKERTPPRRPPQNKGSFVGLFFVSWPLYMRAWEGSCSACLVIASTGPVVQYRQHYWETAETFMPSSKFPRTFPNPCSRHARWGVAGNTKEGGTREGEDEEGTRDPTDRR